MTTALDNEFTLPDVKNFTEQDQSKLIERFKAYIVIKLYIDSSLILYALDKNGAAIIELHSVLERQAIERVLALIVLPERTDVGRRVVERMSLQDLAPILLECGIFDKDDIKFTERLCRLRNGLAHRNPRIISNAVLSGQKIRESEIEAVVSDVDYIPYATGGIRLLTKILEWEETI